ncbi:unnamed protein product [Fusarium graminearum]|uniref:Uncharacterized protein n=1 Tax=Gibberella zeae TaxID=5518 RepID=A0A4E9E9C4_GIBZA|nr:unnamed protein product [Fusarium graminearum]CAG1999057.1 unnamed protein product [Fusarium graminearum]
MHELGFEPKNLTILQTRFCLDADGELHRMSHVDHQGAATGMMYSRSKYWVDFKTRESPQFYQMFFTATASVDQFTGGLIVRDMPSYADHQTQWRLQRQITKYIHEEVAAGFAPFLSLVVLFARKRDKVSK